MEIISLFSGCGGLDIGAERAGARVIYANDIDQDACATLRKYFPHVKVDPQSIAAVDKFPKADVVIGGYPCQPFSMGGLRDPKRDKRTHLYLEFARCLKIVQPKFFVAENVSGLKKIQGGKYLDLQQKAFAKAGRHGYRVTVQLVDAKDYGVPQTRERLFMVGVRRDVGLAFRFPPSTHGMSTLQSRHLKPYASHGDAIKHLPLWPKGEFYERPHNPEEHWSWYYMSRNRKAKWDGPSYTIVASFRHVTLHPGSSAMKRRLRDSTTSEQRWDFSGEYEHIKENPNRPVLKEPRRLSWRECAAIQTFPDGFEPVGDLKSKFNQIGNAVPPLLAEIIVGQLLTGAGLVKL